VPFSYDRRQSLSVVWNWRVGRFDVAGTARAASGFPRTPPAGVRVEAVEVGDRLVPGRIGPNQFAFEVAPGGVAELNSARMPMVARLDLRIGYRPRGVSGRWEVYVESLNVLKHNNPWFVDADIVDQRSGAPRLKEEPVGGLPRVVTFGLRFRFR
jgi:hypothetical protein